MPSGPKRQMSDEWKERVRAKFARGPDTHRSVEKKIGAGSGTISRMLAPSQRTSEYVDAVSAALEIGLPITETRSADEEAMITKFRSLAPADRAAFLRILGLAPRDPD